jgi:hypothetical protein
MRRGVKAVAAPCGGFWRVQVSGGAVDGSGGGGWQVGPQRSRQRGARPGAPKKAGTITERCMALPRAPRRPRGEWRRERWSGCWRRLLGSWAGPGDGRQRGWWAAAACSASSCAAACRPPDVVCLRSCSHRCTPSPSPPSLLVVCCVCCFKRDAASQMTASGKLGRRGGWLRGCDGGSAASGA